MIDDDEIESRIDVNRFLLKSRFSRLRLRLRLPGEMKNDLNRLTSTRSWPMIDLANSMVNVSRPISSEEYLLAVDLESKQNREVLYFPFRS